MLHYCLTKGENPYDFHKRRELNQQNTELLNPILNQEKIMTNIDRKWKNPLAIELIEFMCNFSAIERPETESILKHPLFWSDQLEFNFFQVCFEFMNGKIDMRQLKKSNIESGAENILHNNWIDLVIEDISITASSFTNNEITSLLKCIHDNVRIEFLTTFLFNLILFFLTLRSFSLNQRMKKK